MNCAFSRCARDMDEVEIRRREVERILKEEETAMKMLKPCLLLGTSESGKSTVLKQMQIMHRNGFNENERKLYHPIIFMNVVDSLCILLQFAKDNNITLEKPIHNEFMNEILSLVKATIALTADIKPKMSALINDKEIRKLLETPEGFYLPSSTSYFFDAFDRICAPGWIPSDDDILYCRKATAGVQQIDFDVGKGNIIRLIDVAGQKNARKKWIHFFENVNTIIFCASLIDYDLPATETPEKSRMQDSLEVFEAVVNSRWFIRSNVVLFLNKADLFKKKVGRIPIKKFFPNYNDDNRVKPSIEFIAQMYKKKSKSNIRIFAHVTTATDTSSFRSILKAVIGKSTCDNAKEITKRLFSLLDGNISSQGSITK